MPKKILIVEDEYVIAGVLKNILRSGHYEVSGIAISVNEAIDMMNKAQPDFVLLDIHLKGELTGIDLAHHLIEKEIPFIYISANSSQSILEEAKVTRPYGFVIKPFREKDVLSALDIAVYRHEHDVENGFRQNAVLQKKVAEILISKAGWEEKILQMGKALQLCIPYEFLSVGLRKENGVGFYDIGFARTGFDEYQVVRDPELMVITNRKANELEMLKAADKPDQLATWYTGEELNALPKRSFKRVLADSYGFKSHLCLPLPLTGGKTGYFDFYSRRSHTYHAEHLVMCNRILPLFSSFMENMLQVENSPMAPALHHPSDKRASGDTGESEQFEGIIGRSQLLLNVLDKVMQVAAADSTVLILGESGTGKERIAERICALSRRSDKPFVKINCAALPLSLIDSALFGHEKGAFTDAHDRKTGKFEQAHTGTIFLDEIGELPLEVQSKLLRVLQEREVDRIGGNSPVKVDVRVIAATNRNLEKEVAEGRFRLDLYYRINVFPITLPPLRDRPEDIEVLSAYFLKVFNERTAKKVTGISTQVLKSMKAYHWPGNIRELENLMERNILLTGQGMITSMEFPGNLPHYAANEPPAPGGPTLLDNERAHILSVLKQCKGKIWGPGGAANVLNIPPTTLNSKMKKLGIHRNSWK